MTLSYHELVARLRGEVREMTTTEVAAAGDAALLIDIREPDEFRTGIIPGSALVPRGNLEGAVRGLVPDPTTPVVLVCAAGNRSVLSAASLQTMGYSAVASMAGGINAWRAEGRLLFVPGAHADPDVEPAVVITGEDAARYARHLTLREVGPAGQTRLGEASVLIVGAGGLGSPAVLYLAAAGVGRIGIADPDVVDITNLQRQVIHDATRIGLGKTTSAAQAVRRLNPNVEVEEHPVRVDSDNVLELMRGYEVVIDAADNFPTRYLINDAALHLRLPVVHGSVFRFEGQATVFRPYTGPCYRCLFPLPPPPELAPNCAEAGVLGVLPGTIGTIQATEAIKLVLGLGETLAGVLLTYDALHEEFSRLRFSRNPGCPACGDETSPPPLVDYDATCAPVT